MFCEMQYELHKKKNICPQAKELNYASLVMALSFEDVDMLPKWDHVQKCRCSRHVCWCCIPQLIGIQTRQVAFWAHRILNKICTDIACYVHDDVISVLFIRYVDHKDHGNDSARVPTPAHICAILLRSFTVKAPEKVVKPTAGNIQTLPEPKI